MDLLDSGCIFIGDEQRDADCEADESPSPSASADAHRRQRARPSRPPSPDARSHAQSGRALPSVVDPAVGRQGAPQHPADRRRPAPERGHLQHRHADRRLDRPGDEAGRDVQPAARHRRRAGPAAAPPGASSGRVYAGKINSWFATVRNRVGPLPGQRPRRAATTPSRRSSASCTGSTSSTSSRSTSRASRRSSTRSAASRSTSRSRSPTTSYPGDRRATSRRVYIPSGLQHMNGAEALRYARSRHTLERLRPRRPPAARAAVAARAGRPADLIPRLPSSSRRSRRRSGPTSRSTSSRSCSGSPRRSTRTNIRSYVFAPPLYGTTGPRQPARLHHRARTSARSGHAVKDAFTADPADEAAPPEAGRRRARGCGSSTGPASDGRGSTLAGFLDVPRPRRIGAAPEARRARCRRTRRSSSTTAPRRSCPTTIAYLEKTFGVEVTTKTDPAIRSRHRHHDRPGHAELEAPPGPDGARLRLASDVAADPAPVATRSASASGCTRAGGRGPRRSSGRGQPARSGRSRRSPTGRWSTSMTGETWTPVPHRNTSSATYSSERSIERVLDRDALVLEDLHDRLAGHALEQVVADRRRERDAVADHEQVRGRRLVDVAVRRSGRPPRRSR